MPMPFCGPDKLLVPTWTLVSGTSVGGDYVIAALTDQNPALPLWIEESSIGLQGDLGSAMRIDGVALIHHNFVEGTDLRLRVHSAASWGGAVDIEVTVTVGPWLGRFAPHIYFNVALEEPTEADRTRQYLFLDNPDANTAPIQIGEIVVAGEVEELELGMMPSPRVPVEYGRSTVQGKKGPKYIHDRRTRDRRWIGQTGLDETDRLVFEALQDQSYGFRPFLAWPRNSIAHEPVYARFQDPIYDPTDLTGTHAEAPLVLEELSCGEAY